MAKTFIKQLLLWILIILIIVITLYFWSKPKRKFYICSYGGCGSTILYKYLSNFGDAYHIHSRFPPQNLTLVEKANDIDSRFTDVEIGDADLSNYTVIYIYRNPIHAIYSRFEIPVHLTNIGSDDKITIQDVVDSHLDLYGIGEFYDNYTGSHGRNYKTYCVKYEDFFDNIELFNDAIGLDNRPELYPVKSETERKCPQYNELYPIYSDLIGKQERSDFITHLS